MPTSPLKPCSYPGCSGLVQRGYCEVHRQQRPVSFVRDPERQRLYDRKWQVRRRIQLANEPWCADCLDQGVYTPATDVHHEERHQGNAIIFLRSPLRSLCHACHSARTADEVGFGARGGAKKDSPRGLLSGWGRPHEKSSPISAVKGAPDADAV